MLNRKKKRRTVMEENEARTKEIHDCLPRPLGGMSEDEANDLFQADYRIVPSSEISQITPERVYPGPVYEGMISTCSDWKATHSCTNIGETLPGLCCEVPTAWMFLVNGCEGKDGRGSIPLDFGSNLQGVKQVHKVVSSEWHGSASEPDRI